MSRFLTAVAFVVLMPDVAFMQVMASGAVATESAQDTPRAAPPGVPAGDPQGPPPAPQGPPPAPRAPQAQPPPTQPPTIAAPQPPRKIRGRDLNVQVELTINDYAGTAAPDKRVVSMVIADGAFGRIRSSDNPNNAMLNVDARPEILDNDRLVVEMTIEYRPLPPEGASPARRPTALNEQLTIILQNGKPLLVSQAADPMVDRKMTVEVRASILK